jgi:hypothetical protein
MLTMITLGPNLDGPNGCSDRGCDNGTLGMAWGSGTANFPYLITPDSALQNQAIADGTVYQSILGMSGFFKGISLYLWCMNLELCLNFHLYY